MTLTNAQKLEKICVVTPQITIWTGETVLRDWDINLGEGGELPPKEFAKLGNKALINKERLKVFRNIRENFKRALSLKGVPFLGGYAIEVSQFASMKENLDSMIANFQAELENLCRNYDAVVDEWIQMNPKYATSIQQAKLPVEKVRGRFSASYAVNKVLPLDGEEETLLQQVGGLHSVLMHEIRKEASEYLRKSLMGNNKISQKARSVLKRITTKLDALAFLNPNVVTLSGILKTIDLTLPKKGYLEGEDFFKMYSLMSILSSQELTEKISQGSDMGDIQKLFSSCASSFPEQKLEEKLLEQPTTEPTASAADSILDLELDELLPEPSPVEKQEEEQKPELDTFWF